MEKALAIANAAANQVSQPKQTNEMTDAEWHRETAKRGVNETTSNAQTIQDAIQRHSDLRDRYVQDSQKKDAEGFYRMAAIYAQEHEKELRRLMEGVPQVAHVGR